MENIFPTRPQNTHSTAILVNLPTETLLRQALTQSCIIAGSQQPVPDHTQNKIIYFQSTRLADGEHKVDIKVTTANETNPFILDYFRIVPSIENSSSMPSSTSSLETSHSTPSPTSTSSALPDVSLRSIPVGAMVGGVVGGIAGIVILVLALLWCFLRKRPRGGQAYYFEKPSPADILAGEGP